MRTAVSSPRSTESREGSAAAAGSRRLLVLGLLSGSQLVVSLDATIAVLALPSIRRDLDVPLETVQWVVGAYTLFFAGFLLLGGRLCDLLGPRRVFVAGAGIFLLASLLAARAGSAELLLAARAGSAELLLAARAAEGLGAALFSPAALSILGRNFDEGTRRTRALGVWSVFGGVGAGTGALLGGFVTGLLGWRWIFTLDAGVGAGMLVLGLLLLEPSRGRPERARSTVAPAAVVTSALLLAVYSLAALRTEPVRSAALLGTAALLFAAFVALQSRADRPLVPPSLFRLRTRLGGSVGAGVTGLSFLGMCLVLSVYMQSVLGYSPLRTGLALFAEAAGTVAGAALALPLVLWRGAKRVAAVGMTLIGVALLWFTRLPAGGVFAADLLPGLLLSGVGLGLSVVSTSVAGLAAVPERRSGAAAGVLRTAEQVGGAVGVALAAVAIATSGAVSASGASPALLPGLHRAAALLAGIALAGGLVSLILIRRRELTSADAGRAARWPFRRPTPDDSSRR